MSKDREWLPQADHNQLSWSFAFAVIAGFFSLFAALAMSTNYIALHSQHLLEESSQTEALLKSGAHGGAGSVFGGTLPPGSGGYDASGGAHLLAGTDSRLGGGVPSLFTAPPVSAFYSSVLGGPAASAFSHATSHLTPGTGLAGAPGGATSAATVSARLREQLQSARQTKQAVMGYMAGGIGPAAIGPAASVPVETSAPGLAGVAQPQFLGSMASLHGVNMPPTQLGSSPHFSPSATMQNPNSQYGSLARPMPSTSVSGGATAVYGSPPQMSLAMDTTV
ncbi:unnamed protein product [Protopolystoma xenopodis]|uniref:Uncharacterized protein n=1 Tax=Protopolystoma xenopodis TaxID=117903 RepID=A0A3S5AT93_9PLAT|nr:unnamed protein product [Protopolystoma xenopodis]